MDNIDSCLYIDDGRLKDYAASCARLLHPQDNCPGREAAALLCPLPGDQGRSVRGAKV